MSKFKVGDRVRVIITSWLLTKHQDEFKTEVVDKLLEEGK